jgi:hypothetical protein
VTGQFNSPIRLPQDGDQVPISGPLLNVDPEARKATVVCVLVQGKENDPANAVWVEGTGTWERGGGNMWTGTVSRNGVKPGGGNGSLQAGTAAGEVRGIATATIVRDGSIQNGHLVPPSLETITWCVGVRIEDEGGVTQSA